MEENDKIPDVNELKERIQYLETKVAFFAQYSEQLLLSVNSGDAKHIPGDEFAKAEVDRLRKDLASLRASKSWRITAPLRYMQELMLDYYAKCKKRLHLVG